MKLEEVLNSKGSFLSEEDEKKLQEIFGKKEAKSYAKAEEDYKDASIFKLLDIRTGLEEESEEYLNMIKGAKYSKDEIGGEVANSLGFAFAGATLLTAVNGAYDILQNSGEYGAFALGGVAGASVGLGLSKNIISYIKDKHALNQIAKREGVISYITDREKDFAEDLYRYNSENQIFGFESHNKANTSSNSLNNDCFASEYFDELSK